MNLVNLLPANYVTQRDAKVRRRLVVRLSLAIACLCTVWAGVLFFQVHNLNKQVAKTNVSLHQLEEQWAGIEQTDGLCKILSQKLDTLDQLRNPVSMHAVLALLSQLFPEEGVLQNLAITVPDAAIQNSGHAIASNTSERNFGNSKRAFPGQSKHGSQHQASTQYNAFDPNAWQNQAVRIELQGLVSSDVKVAQLARKLSETGLFRNVRIDDAQQITFNKQTFHQFRLSIEIPVYQSPATHVAEGV